MKRFLTAAALAALLPAAADAQRDVTRRAYTFLEDRLVVAVHAQAPGELQVVRGQRGRVEVAARSRDGFAGFGLGGDYTRQLRLTAVGSDLVQYLVVVPEHVAVSVQLPRGGTSDVTDSDGVQTYRWGAATAPGAGPDRHSGFADDAAAAPAHASAMLPTTHGGLYVVHSADHAPALIDVPDLASVRSVSVRVEGSDFRVAASRPLSLRPGSAGHMRVQVAGDPLDLVLFVPRSAGSIELRSGSTRLAQVTGGRPVSFCGGSIVQQPTAHQHWLTIFPSSATSGCR